MNRILAVAAAALVLALAPQLATAQSADADMREQFEAVINGLNDNKFEPFQRAVNETALINRIFGTQVIDADAREQFAAGFSGTLQELFISSFPRARTQAESGGEIIGTIIAFQFQDGHGRAIVRYAGKGYRFSYHSYELTRSRNKLVIVDWFDYYNSSWFSEDVGDSLVRAMPAKASVRSIMKTPNPTDGQVFQVGELLKAVRDQNPQRYFQIYDGLEAVLRNEPHIVVLNYQYCRSLGDPARLNQAVESLVAAFPGDALYSLGLSAYYISRNLFEEAIVELDRFESALGMKDGVSEAFKATSAVALGDFERAQAFALSATQVEPGL
ncbi:MAG TPA: hypothetical protein VJ993_05905, partial [Woeseiaceae bacterium]|nr:hypothetical protein [Woeseiaceae bacterium]